MIGLPVAVVGWACALLGAAITLLSAAALAARSWRQRQDARRNAAEAVAGPLLLRVMTSRESGPDDPDDVGAYTTAVFARRLEEMCVRLVGKLRGDDRAALVDLMRRKGVVDRARRDTRSRHTVVRLHAVELLGALAVDEGLPELVARLRDRSPDVVRASVRALGRSGAPEAATALLGLLDTPHPWVSEHSVTGALLRLGPVAAPGLVLGAAAGSPQTVRVCCRVLGWLGDPGAVDVLCSALTADDAATRAAASQALGRIGLPAAVPMLQSQLGAHNAPGTRAAAAAALGDVGDPSSCGMLAALLAEEHDVARAAAGALLRLGAEGRAWLARSAGSVPEAREALGPTWLQDDDAQPVAAGASSPGGEA